jgi:hypothetical protein
MSSIGTFIWERLRNSTASDGKLTLHALGIFYHALATLTDKPGLSGGNPHHQCMGGDIPGNYRTSANERVRTDGYTANNGGIGPDGHPFFDMGRQELVFLVSVRPRVSDIGENSRRPNEYIVGHDHAVVKRHIVLNVDAISNGNFSCHKDVLPQYAIIPNDASPHQVTEMPDTGARANGGRLIDDCGGMYHRD